MNTRKNLLNLLKIEIVILAISIAILIVVFPPSLTAADWWYYLPFAFSLVYFVAITLSSKDF
jgi:hypothetical protein